MAERLLDAELVELELLRDLSRRETVGGEPLPVWIALGGTPASVVRAGSLALPLALGIIGGLPERFAPMVELYLEFAR